MSTRTRIGYEQEDGTIRSIYCHSDGYPSWTGKKLRDHYDGDEAKVVDLVNTGYISCLFPTVEECVEKRHNTGIPHIASDPDAYYTYGRDNCDSEWIYYLQRDGMWLGSKVSGPTPNWLPLDLLIERYDD